MRTIVLKMRTFTNNENISSTLFGKTRRLVLSLLYSHPDETFYVGQIAKITGISKGTVYRELKNLTSSGIVKREAVGHQIYYSANKKCPIFNEIKEIVIKTFGVVDVLKIALSPLSDKVKLAFIYGSFAQGYPNNKSDIDLIVIGRITFSEIIKALASTQERLRRDVNPTVYSLKDFNKKLSEKHHFLTSVIRGKIIFLIGSENELRRMG